MFRPFAHLLKWLSLVGFFLLLGMSAYGIFNTLSDAIQNKNGLTYQDVVNDNGFLSELVFVIILAHAAGIIGPAFVYLECVKYLERTGDAK